MSGPPAGTVEVFADVCCPFTHVGLRRLVARREAAGAGRPTLVVRAWPLEWVNDQPLDAALIAEEVDELREQVAPDLFSGFRAEAFPTTSLPALALADRAYAVSPATGEAVSLALRDALFEEGLDIGDAAVLGALAARYGVAGPGPAPDEGDLVKLRADWEAGRGRGVVGSPHFFAGQADAFCPSLTIVRVDGHLRIDADPAALDRFLDEVLG